MKKAIIFFLASLFFSIGLMAAPVSVDSMKINVNTASPEQLDKGLLGVGMKVAMEIVDYRKAHGAFKTVDDLDKVKYIGAKFLEKNKDRIIFE